MLINPEAMVIITSNASGEKGWDTAEDRREEKTKRAVERPAACWKHGKDG